MQFVANLRNETLDAFAAEAIQPRAYLLSSHRVTPATLEAARRVRELGLPLFADNGTKELIDRTIDGFAAAAAPIADEIRTIRRELGRVPRGSDVPPDLQRRAKELADGVIDHATSLSDAVDPAALLELQLSMRPTDLIAQEDFATACLLGLGLERETTGFSVDRFATRNRRSLRLWTAVKNDPRCAGLRVYAVLSAVDFNTARAAGRLAAAHGVRFAALGIAGINRDSFATDFFVIGRGSHRLARAAPRRYVRLIQILLGLATGVREAGGSLDRFHCLGLGAAVMFPLPAVSFAECTALSTDATSPIHDAIRDQVYYELTRQGGRVSTSEIANRELRDEPWSFASPFEQQFRQDFGHDVAAAKAWWTARGEPEITRDHLRADVELSTALPLLGEHTSEVRRRGERVRVAANHWRVGELADVFSAAEGRHERARAVLAELSAGQSTIVTRGVEAATEILAATA